jgi:predicted acylesterase/phospholipase RssA
VKFSEKKRIALVLSGGGVKAAAFHIGVCLALREKGFKFAGGRSSDDRLVFESQPLTITTYVGSSAGAVVTAFLAAGHSVDAVIDAFTRGSGLGALTRFRSEAPRLKPLTYRDIFALNVDAGLASRFLPRFFYNSKRPIFSGGLEVLLKRGFKMNGLFTTKNLEKYIRAHVFPENDFAQLGAKLFVVATQLNHSRKTIFSDFEETTKTKNSLRANFATVSEAVAASTALPGVFAPVGIKTKTRKEKKEVEMFFFDGEIRDTLSTHVAADNGADLVISSYSIQPYHYTPEMGSLHEYGIPIIFNQALYQLVQQKIERHIRHQSDVRSMIKAVEGYMSEAGIDSKHIEKLVEILINRTRFNPSVDYIYIHPSPQDYEFFFADHFSLNGKVMAGIVRAGFKAAMNTLRPFNI